jgi:2-polyprenyl-6-methoxyphenol hydroxylase-like FAD-dependent oxidoreductase
MGEPEPAASAETTDVAIIGAGPTGLMLAIELCLAGVSSVLLERLDEISEIPKGNGLFGQIVPWLDYRGLLEPLRADATYTGPVPSFFYGPLTLPFSRLPASPLSVLALPQRQIERKLADRLRELGGTTRRGHELSGLSKQEDSVLLDVDGPGRSYQLRARYVVGCDGAHSTVRKQAGIGFPGITSDAITRIGRVLLPADMIAPGSGEVEVPGIGRLRNMHPVRTQGGTYTIGPLRALDKNAAPNAYLVSTQEEDPDADLTAPMTLGELRASFARVLGTDLPMSEPQWLTRLVGNSRQAERYRDGRVLLAGDAAHVFGVGGSLNAGMLDAVNLGWKLAAEVRGRAPAGLLDSYQTERHAAGRRVLLQSRAQRALQSDDEYALALRELVGELLQFAEPQRHLGEMIAGSDIRYDMTGPASSGGPGTQPHPLTGRLAPDLQLKTDDGRTSIAMLMRAARPVLLDFGPDDRVAAAAAKRSRHVPFMRAKVVGGSAPADAMLIRADGWVAWATGPQAANPAAGLADAVSIWCELPAEIPDNFRDDHGALPRSRGLTDPGPPSRSRWVERVATGSARRRRSGGRG